MNIVIFFVSLSFMVLIHELGHFVMAKRAKVKVEEFGLFYPPRLFGVKRGETVYSVNLIPIGGFVRMLGEEDPADPRSLARATKRWRIAVLVAGPGMNLILAALLFAGSFMAGVPSPVPGQVLVGNVSPGSPAEAAGLRPGDIIRSVGGEKIVYTPDVRAVTRANAGKIMLVEIARDGDTLTLNVRPRGEGADYGTIGVSLSQKIDIVAYSPHTALLKGVQQTGEAVAMTFYVPVLVLRGQAPAEAVRPTGPVGIYDVVTQATSESIARNWWFPVLFIAGLISAGLGVANLLPIPGLDGGRLLFVGLEAVRGRRVNPQREGFIHLVGIAFLLSVVALISYFDLVAPIGAIRWGP